MTARVVKGRCSSGKTRYRNRKAVIAGISLTIQRQRELQGVDIHPLHYYRCTTCRGWHMTKLVQGGTDA